MTIDELWMSLRSAVLKQTVYLPSTFDIHYSIFDIRFSKASAAISRGTNGQRLD
jgi:hypothetical protein